MNIINNIIGLNVQFVLLYIVLDVLLFPRRDNTGIFWRLLFSNWIGTNGRKLYYVYRPLQFALLLTGVWFSLPAFQPFIFQFSYFAHLLYSLIPAITYLLAFCLYVTDLWYYVFNLELEEVFAFEKTDQDTYWLEHFYQIGHYTWKSFSLKQFLWFSILGTILLIISNYI